MNKNLIQDSISKQSKDTQAWYLIGAFVLFLCFLFLVQSPQLLVLLYPSSSLALGIYLYLKYPIIYVRFAWWLIFMGPLVRRIIDLQSGYLTLGLLNFTPLMVATIPIVSIFKLLPKTGDRQTLLFTISSFSIIYGLLIGLIQNNPVNAIANSLVAWLSPVVMGFHLYINWRDYPYYRGAIESTFKWALPIISFYGLFQFLVAPEWDQFWLITSELGARGTPEPFGMRLWSTMDNPAEFANAVLISLLLFLGAPYNALTYLIIGAGYISFLLTLARSAWLGWALGVTIFIFSQKSRNQITAVATLSVIVILILPIAFMEPFSEVIGTRLATLSELSSDVSFNARLGGYGDLLDLVSSQFIGNGIGSSINVENTTIAAWDSGLLVSLFQLGWLGIIPYMASLSLLLLDSFQSKSLNLGYFEALSFIVPIEILSQVGFTVIFIGPIGIMLWSFLGLNLAASRYYK